MLSLLLLVDYADREPWQLWVGTLTFFLVLYLFYRLLLKLEKKGIIKPGRRPSGRAAPAILHIQSIFELTKRHVLEEKLIQRKRDQGTGGPDKAGEQEKDDFQYER